jgi:quinol monooxygenase YgiN
VGVIVTASRDAGVGLITMRLRPGKENDLPKPFEQLQVAEQPASGLVRSTAIRDENDPSRVYILVVFESEDRAREQDEQRQQGLEAARATMAEIFDARPEFVDLAVVNDFVV